MLWNLTGYVVIWFVKRVVFDVIAHFVLRVPEDRAKDEFSAFLGIAELPKICIREPDCWPGGPLENMAKLQK